jgi:hypothetical protein
MKTSVIVFVFIGALPLATAACDGGGGGESGSTSAGSGGTSTASAIGSTVDTSSATGDGGASASTTSGATSGTGGGGPMMFVEKALDVQLTLAGAALTITVKDGDKPVLTDAWLYTLESGALVPLTGFTDPDSKRRDRGLMLPCTLGGAPSGLAPCNKGELNGIMTDAIREKIVGGMTQSAIDGTVSVTLNAAPTSPVVVVVAREDQRYAGAAAITPDNKPATLPAGVGAPETHAHVTYSADVKPIVDTRCGACHASGGIAAEFSLQSYDAIVLHNFGYDESVKQCEAQFPSDPAGLDACKKAISHVQFMVEPGAPALSSMLRRARPDEDKGASVNGLKWFGSKNSRFGGHGDRRMPPSNTTADTSDDDPKQPIYFDEHAASFQVLFDWVAQGAPK